MSHFHVLIILPMLPWPLSSGGHQGIFNSLKAVSQFCDIHLVYYAGQKDTAACYHDELKKQLGGNVIIHPYVDNPMEWDRSVAFRKIANKIFKRMDLFDYILFTKLHDNAYYDFVNSIIEQYKIDLVQVEMAECMDFVLTLPPSVKRLFVHHEIRYVRNERFLDKFGRSLRNVAHYEQEKIKEIALLNRYDTVITVSEKDKDLLIESGVTVPVHASFSIVNTSIGGTVVSAPGSHRLVYVGPEVHYPNKVGLEWFLEKVWPLVKEKDGRFTMDIIGNWSKNTSKEWAKRYSDVHFVGFVDDLATAMQGATMVVPIFVGSGIRMKILEAMSLGVPFVSTTVGAEGIPVQNGVHGFISDYPEEFADQIMMAEDASVRKRLTQESLKLVREKFSFEQLSRDRIGVYNKLLDNCC